jgi:hypothetical protein
MSPMDHGEGFVAPLAAKLRRWATKALLVTDTGGSGHPPLPLFFLAALSAVVRTHDDVPRPAWLAAAVSSAFCSAVSLMFKCSDFCRAVSVFGRPRFFPAIPLHCAHIKCRVNR